MCMPRSNELLEIVFCCYGTYRTFSIFNASDNTWKADHTALTQTGLELKTEMIRHLRYASDLPTTKEMTTMDEKKLKEAIHLKARIDDVKSMIERCKKGRSIVIYESGGSSFSPKLDEKMNADIIKKIRSRLEYDLEQLKYKFERL